MNRLSSEQINKYYIDALEYFKSNYPQFDCQIVDNSFIVGYKWKDSTNLAGLNIAREVSTYRCVIKILSNWKFCTSDVIIDDVSKVGINGGNLSLSAFAGRAWNYNKEINFGKNNVTGEKGINTYEFCTSEIQRPVKQYFVSLGLKPKFYSYRLNIKLLPKIQRIVTVVLPLCIGLPFLLIALLVHSDVTFKLVFGFISFICIFWGLYNFYIIKSKD